MEGQFARRRSAGGKSAGDRRSARAKENRIVARSAASERRLHKQISGGRVLVIHARLLPGIMRRDRSRGALNRREPT